MHASIANEELQTCQPTATVSALGTSGLESRSFFTGWGFVNARPSCAAATFGACPHAANS